MSDDAPRDWGGLLWETRGYLGLDEDDPVPVDELVEQAVASGCDEPNVREALRDTDALEAVGDDPDDLRVRAVEDPREQPPAADCEGETPTPDGSETTTRDSDTPVATGPLADGVAKVAGEHYPPEIVERDVWVSWILDGVGRKRPVGPWKTGHAYPVKWASDLPQEERPETDFETAKRWADFSLDDLGLSLPDDAQSDGLQTGIILPHDRPPREERFTLIDWDDVRDPDTGDIHPVAAEYITEYGGYVEVSTSGEGLHQYVSGGLRKRGKFIAPIDDEPFMGDDLPQVEMYDGGRHVAMTGRFVEGADEDAVEGQELIDAIVREYADAEKDAGHRRYDPDTGEADGDADNDATGSGGEVPKPDTGEYDGPALEQLRDTQPDDRPLRYHAAVFAFYRGGGEADGYARVLNWRLEGIAAATGEQACLSPQDVKDDLAGEYLEDAGVEQVTKHQTPHRVDYAHQRAGDGRLEAPSTETLVDYGVLPPTAIEDDGGEDDRQETPRDLLELDVVVEPANALTAAAAVEPDDLDEPLPELERDDVTDVAIAVALAEGDIDSPDTFPPDGRYTQAYYRARDHYGAPLPKYLDNSTLEERDDLVVAAAERVAPEHILDGCRSTVTVDDPPTDTAVARLNPTWERSERGERIVAGYGRGFYCVEHEVSFSAIQLAALEAGLIDAENEYPTGEAFKEAYRILREQYGAPVPRWRATVLEHVAVLPPAARVVGDASVEESLSGARRRTEALVRDAVGVRDRAQLITSAPATGKTYSTAVVADDRPVLYVASRNDLKQQMEDYAREITHDDEDHPDAEPSVLHLPIFAENRLSDAAIDSGVAAVRREGFDLLKDADALLAEVEQHLGGDPDDEPDGGEDDEVDLERASCHTAEGAYGDAWRVRVQVARGLGLQPATIHKHDKALFGATLPCHDDEHGGDGDSAECEYTRGWDRVRDPDRPVDILVGGPQHGHVDSATTHYARGPDGKRELSPRAVVVDEFPGDTYVSEYSDRYLDHAVWLAEALVGVDTREDLLAADLDTDTWVSCWLDGDGDEHVAAAEVVDALDAARAVAAASDTARELREHDRVGAVEVHTTLNVRRLRGALDTVIDAAPGDGDDLEDTVSRLDAARDQLQTDADRAYADGHDAGALYDLVRGLESILDDLEDGIRRLDGEADLADALRERIDALAVDGDLRELLEAATDAVRGDAPAGLLDAAVAAVKGGRDGCRALAVFGSDGDAHPDAWALLAGAIADADAAHVEEVTTASFSFDREEPGGVFKHLSQNGATVVGDKDHKGALVVDTPSFTHAEGGKCPVVGLDATGRPSLWKIALGRDAQRRDIHDTAAERRRFFGEVMNLRVVQTADTALPYHGDPHDKRFNEDVELVRAVADEYTGGGPDSIDDKAPAVISTLKVINYLGDELDEHAGAAVNYENMKGSDALESHQVAVILGSQHYGDAAPERWALLAGEDAGRGDTSGATLDYGSAVANDYLRYMREDHTMQAILRAGRNEDASVVFAHTSALREDVPVDNEGAVVSAHSRGTLAVADAAAELRRPFTARQVAAAIDDDDRGVGLRQVQNVLAQLRDQGYLRTVERGGPGVAYEYELEEDPGLADVELDVEATGGQNENPANSTLYSWNFVSPDGDRDDEGLVRSAPPPIPANDTPEEAIASVGPPG